MADVSRYYDGTYNWFFAKHAVRTAADLANNLGLLTTESFLGDDF